MLLCVPLPDIVFSFEVLFSFVVLLGGAAPNCVGSVRYIGLNPLFALAVWPGLVLWRGFVIVKAQSCS